MSDIAEPDNDSRDGAEYLGVLLPAGYTPPQGYPSHSNELDYATFKAGAGYDWDWYALTLPQGVKSINIALIPERWDGTEGGTSGGLSVESIQQTSGPQVLAFDTNPNDGNGLPDELSADFDVTSLFENDQPLVTFYFAVFGGKLTSGSIQNPPDIWARGDYTLTVDLVEYVTDPSNNIPGAFNALEYIASYPDLSAAFGADASAGLAHWAAYGNAEGRSVSFDALQYVASYADLIAAFGPDRDLGAAHYIQYGRNEGRSADDFDEAQYLANYPDLQQAFGGDTDAATRHFITNGYFEGRTDEPLPSASLDAMF